MSESASLSPLRDFGLFSLAVVGAGAVLCAIGYLPTRSVAGSAGVSAMLTAVAATVLASVIGGVPILLARLRGEIKPQTVMVSMVVRLVVVVLLAASLGLAKDLPLTPFLLWLGISYLLLLVIDTLFAMTVTRTPTDRP